jgi:ABC-type uncharacterized transport system involved in gliding motility auxiliary subunit
MLVTQPGRDLTEQELRLLDDFLMRGQKTLIVIAGAANVAQGDSGMNVELDAHGIEQLLDRYGIEMKQDLVFDWQNAVKLTAERGSASSVSVAAIPVAQHDPKAPPEKQQLDAGFAGFFQLEELAFPLASSLVLHAERQPQATLRAVARTSGETTSVSGARVSARPGAAAAPAGERSQRTIAAVVEGTLKSAYTERQAQARVLVIAAPAFVTNPFARTSNSRENSGLLTADPVMRDWAQGYAQRHLTSVILSVKNLLDWSAADESLIACAALLVRKPEAD